MTEKIEKVKKKLYTEGQMMDAVQAVRGGMKICNASRKYEVPWSTLSDRVKGRVKEGAKPGRDAELSPLEELTVVDFVCYMARRNMPMQRADLKKTIVDMIRRAGTKRVMACPFNLTKGPSNSWFQRFERRHPEIKLKVPETLDRGRDAQAKDYVIDKFFNLYESILRELGIMEKPHLIFNCDETWANDLNRSRQQSYGCTGEEIAKHDHITVMMAASAAGRVLPSMLIYKACLPALSSSDAIPKSWHYAKSDKGYIDKELFLQWFKELFIPNCGDERPVLLLMDNHNSHFSYEVCELARKNQIEFLAFPSHTTHILQPLNVGIFGQLKKKYRELCVTTGLKYQDITVGNFATVWSTCVKQAATPLVVKSAFRRSGIYPFDPCGIDDSKVKYVSVVVDPLGSSVMPATASNKPTTATRVLAVNTTVGAIAAETEPCQLCHMYPPLAGNGRNLPAELQLEFPKPQTLHCNCSSTAVKRSRPSVPLSLWITGEAMVQKVKEKEERKEREEAAREARKLKREEKKDKQKKVSKKTYVEPENKCKKLVMPPSKKAKVETVTRRVSMDDCGVCQSSLPPARRTRKQSNIDWVYCDTCQQWFHCVCLKLKVNQLGDSFVCEQCT